MKLIDHNLFIEFAELEACDISRRTILSWDNIKDPTDKRKVLVSYEDLKEKYQQAIISKYGDPYIYVHNQTIKQFLRMDTNAQEFFTSYRTNGIALPGDYIRQYITCANWLNLLIEVENNWSKCKKTLCMTSKPELYEAAIRIFETEVIKLPTTYQTLKRKISDYKEQGYSCIVSKKFGNDNSKKVKDELNTAILIEMLSDAAQFDDTFISIKYNKAAEVAGFKTITPVTVGNYRKASSPKIDGFRKGNGAWYDTAGKTIHRSRPSAPLLMINADDNELDLYFQEVRVKNGGNTVNYYYRPVIYVVTDAYNDYILGYAVGETQTTELVKQAFLNAANHVKELTGDHYMWRQIVADHWNKKGLEPFFTQQAHFTPAGARNARAKVIEQSFSKKWHNKLKELFPRNYSGHNITAKSKLNRDAIEANKKFFPRKEEAAAHIDFFINEMRSLVEPSTGKTKQQLWLEAFECMQAKEKRLIQPEQHLMWLGHDHKNQRSGLMQTNTVTKNGLTPVIDGYEYVYEIPQHLYRETIGLKVNIKYDPYDMSRVLATSEDERIRFVCQQFQSLPMALADHTTETRQRLNSLLEEKKSHVMLNIGEREERMAVLERANIDAASLLQAGVLKKELKQAAERQLEQNTGGKRGGSIYDRM